MICRDVIYRTKRGKDCPAKIVGTVESLDPEGLERFKETGGSQGVPPLTSETHVHLVVFTPGLPNDPARPLEFASPLGGTFQEWDIPETYAGDIGAPDVQPGTWRWPVIS